MVYARLFKVSLSFLLYTCLSLSALAQEPTEVTFWAGHGEPDISVIEAIVDTFNEENPDIRVELVRIPPGSEADVTKLMTAVRGGVGPDVYLFNRPFAAQRAADGILQDLSPFIGDENLGANYLEFAWNEVLFAGKPYALPFDTDARALYYRKDILREAGVDIEMLEPDNGPITLTELQNIASQLNQENARGNYTRLGFVPWFDQGWHYTWGYVFGGSFFDSAACQVTPDNEGVVRAFTFMQNWAKELGAQKVQAFISSANRPEAPPQQHPFITGTIPIMVSGDWFISSMARYAPDAEYGITYIPVPEEGDEPATWSAGWSVVMPQGAKEPEAAYTFMRYFAGEEGQRIYTREAQHFPTWASLLEEDLYDERHTFFNELLPNSNALALVPVGASYWDELTKAQQSVYLEQSTPEEALEAVKARVQAQLQPYCAQLQTER
jgi:multiple sugar transport system substrate-binding protein